MSDLLLALQRYLATRRQTFLDTPPRHVIERGERLARLDELLRLERALGVDVLTRPSDSLTTRKDP